jgi:hypothetical protein
VSRVTPALAILAVLLAATVALALLEATTAWTSAPVTLADPCVPRTFSGSGVDAAVQRIVLEGLDGAACRLGTTREQLVLSLSRGSGFPPRRFDPHTIEVAIRAGLVRAVDDAASRGDVPGLLAPLLRRLVQTAPLERLLQGGITLADLIG